MTSDSDGEAPDRGRPVIDVTEGEPPWAPVPDDDPTTAPAGAGGAVGPGPAGVANPAALIRIGTMVQAMLDEVRQVTLDEDGRQRMSEIHQRAVDAIKETVSDELRDELSSLALPLGEGAPSEAELRIAQAQLVGWLDGLFRGIQAAVFSQQLTAQRQLQQLQQGRRRGDGQYL